MSNVYNKIQNIPKSSDDFKYDSEINYYEDYGINKPMLKFMLKRSLVIDLFQKKAEVNWN